jgi:sugar lactone lactonase YvrE
MRFLTSMVLALALLLSSTLFAQGPPFDQLNREARDAYNAKEYARLVTVMERMNAIRPGHWRVLVNLAGANALAGHPDAAIAVLQRLSAMQVHLDLSDHDFDSLRDDARFVALAAANDALATTRIGSSDVAWTIPEKGLITEGLAYDAGSRSLYVSSARQGKVVRIDARGRTSDFTKKDPALHGLSGMGIDAKRRLLWACSTASARVAGFTKGDPNAAALVAFRLSDGGVAKRVNLEADAFCDDLSVARDGTVYASDSMGAIVRLRPGGDRAETLVPRGKIRSPQGSALSADENILYVSDYGGPIRAIDLATGDVAALQMPADFQSLGIDGLTRHGRSLIAVQNGIEPNRIVRLDLGDDAFTIARATILEMNHPLMNEPTIGKMAGDDYVLVGTSEGNKFDRGEPDPSTLSDGRIFRIHLADQH